MILGLLRLGIVAYLMSQPVLTGFTASAAILHRGLASSCNVRREPRHRPGVLSREHLWVLLRDRTTGMSTAIVLSVTTVGGGVGGTATSPALPRRVDSGRCDSVVE